MIIDWKEFAILLAGSLLISLLLLTGCTMPGPGPSPYPAPAQLGAFDAPNPYPGPNDPEEPQYCIGMVEIPIAVWTSTDGQYIYSQLCGVATAGSWLNISSDTGQAQSISGNRIPANWPCEKYIHYPAINGNLTVEAILLDAGGVTLCDTAQIVRQWQLFPVAVNGTNIFERETAIKRGR